MPLARRPQVSPFWAPIFSPLQKFPRLESEATVRNAMTVTRNPDFSKFQVLAHPCDERESRVFYRQEAHRAEPQGVCYRAYSLQLARGHSSRDLVILVEHGGGREAVHLHSIYGVEADWLLSITDERRLYAALWTLYKTASDAARAAQQETATEYAQAFAEGRLKKRRKAGRVRVEIESRAAAAVDAA